MPADESLSQEPTGSHGDGVSPYKCSTWEKPPGASWSIDCGYCRTSLDHWPESYKQGSSDPRCPTTCKHKAPREVAVEFANVYLTHGAKSAAAMAKTHKGKK